jgi:putative membrane protein
MIYSIFLLARYPEGAIIGISAAIGLYMLYRGFNLDQPFALLRERMKNSYYEGQMTFITYTIAAILAVIATMIGAVTLWQYYITGGSWYYGIVTLITVFINVTIWWYVVAILFADLGKMVDQKLSKTFTIKEISPALFIIAIGLLFWGASTYILSVSALAGETSNTELSLQYFVYSVVGAILVALLGIKISMTSTPSGKMPKKGKDKAKK